MTKLGKNGHTLAEVLIAIMLIGVLSAIIIPTLKKSRPDKDRAMLKKVYYKITSITSELINDDRYYPEADDERPGFRYTDATNYTSYSGSTKFANLFKEKINIASEVPCPSGFEFATPDGVCWHISGLNIAVDLNGENDPNSTGTSAPDRFQFTIGYTGKITIESSIGREYLKSISLQKKED